jgi:hypothetical protein
MILTIWHHEKAKLWQHYEDLWFELVVWLKWQSACLVRYPEFKPKYCPWLSQGWKDDF